MFKNDYPMHLNLQLFAEGAGGDGGTGAEGTQGVSEVAALPQLKNTKSNPLADTKYGIQEDVQTKVTDANGVTAETVDRKAEFEKLIKGEYKEH